MAFDIILFDKAPCRDSLLPLTYTRPVANLRVGILTLAEKWQRIFQVQVSHYTVDYLSARYPLAPSTGVILLIKGNVCPSTSLIEAIERLHIGEALWYNHEWIAAKLAPSAKTSIDEQKIEDLTSIEFMEEPCMIRYPEDIFIVNREQLLFDYHLLTNGRISCELPATNTRLGEQLFIEEGVYVHCCTFNCSEGPIYIGEGAQIEEGCHLRGPLSLGSHTRVKMGTRIYGNVSIGPHCTVGGELSSVVMWGYSSKGHDGYLGCSVIGEGCNLGAGTSNSNLKNNWSTVSLYDYTLSKMRNTALYKCGLIMGDYAMSAINSSFTTGTCVGVGVQYAKSGYSAKFIPNFSWCVDVGVELYEWDRFEQMFKNMKNLKGEQYLSGDVDILKYLHQQMDAVKLININSK
ncbi:putative sugar nucleotidyl transferase [Sphingobacterium sp. SYP-B4668]|uniref:putative sugar nucleotidyl transferase n=1 Tax=Sphingobacterium sp. SYP-B4668 TaxID=2996035 RepID=UPI0022DD900C|nr:putative sugar nucleotidyl transferase [Sphingobacterium sp. SYP-B4668]